MQRYQVYFEPSTMNTLQEFGQSVGVSRSHLLQELANILATRYKTFVKQKKNTVGNILQLSGIILGTATTDVSTKPDSEYFGV